MINVNQSVKDALHNSSRVEKFTLELLDKMGVKKCDLQLIEGYINSNKDAQIVRAGEIKFIYPDTKINYLTDRVAIYYHIRVKDEFIKISLGRFMMTYPKQNKNIVSSQIMDETVNIQEARYIEPKIFLKGTTYIEVLSQLLTSCKIIKVKLEPTNLELQTDIILDDTKSKLEWFNYIAEQINYTSLSVDNEGWFVSKKYKRPSPANVSYIYKADQMSVIVGEIEKSTDFWQIPNVFKRTVSNPEVGELTSLYINNDPTDPFSVICRDYKEVCDFQTVDNIASQEELDILTEKAAFNAKQVTQDVQFNTLVMPFHEAGEILDLRHDELNGIFVESSWQIELKSGAVMKHKAKRLVNLND